MNPNKIFFTSDTHFGHAKLLQYGRPWATVAEMDEELIDRWNTTVPRDGHVFHLGDVSLGLKRDATEAVLSRLRGHKYLVKGNHDGKHVCASEHFLTVWNLHEIKVDDQTIVLCHFPLQSWNKMAYGSWMLHGHSHGNLPAFGKRRDVGVDVAGLNFSPVPFTRLREEMRATAIQSQDHHQPKFPACPHCGTVTETHYGECTRLIQPTQETTRP